MQKWQKPLLPREGCYRILAPVIAHLFNTVKTLEGEKAISRLLKVIRATPSLKFRAAVEEKELCACQLEAISPRQAFVSQHPMVLRNAEVLAWRK